METQTLPQRFSRPAVPNTPADNGAAITETLNQCRRLTDSLGDILGQALPDNAEAYLSANRQQSGQ